MSEHKLANAADFRNAIKDEDCYEPAREIFLPKCGRWVLLRKPRPLAYTLLGAPLPAIPKEDDEVGSAGDETTTSTETRARVAEWVVKLWTKVFVLPKLSLRPRDDEIHPDWIPDKDQQFIWRWIRGEVNDSGESLSTFPGSVQG